ncbi:hypothetical protein [Cohnella kolymensis]|uniref:hypothetical protein n=1 Tax=Cohnella kolymensis TaxID=1590652 RepID=UPI001269D88A|nr:hypothetical protein [Cohnella kolymensis]
MVIIELLKDARTLGNRGMLLYALKPLDYSEHIERLADFMMQGNFEQKHEAKQLIFEMKKPIPTGLIEKLKLKVEHAIVDLEERLDFLSDVADELDTLKSTTS